MTRTRDIVVVFPVYIADTYKWGCVSATANHQWRSVSFHETEEIARARARHLRRRIAKRRARHGR